MFTYAAILPGSLLAISYLPSAQTYPYFKVAYFRVAYFYSSEDVTTMYRCGKMSMWNC